MMRTRVGYTGGKAKHPTYAKLADHTEAIQVVYDPRKVSYQTLLSVFWAAHNPTTKAWSNQYKAAVYVHNAAQRRLAEQSLEVQQRQHKGKSIHTQILPATFFTRAEDYHQKYYLRRQRELFRELRSLYASTRALVDATLTARLNAYVGGYASREQVQEVLAGLSVSEAYQRELLGMLPKVKRRCIPGQGCGR